MPIPIACPKYNRAPQAPDNAAGKKVKCSMCGTLFAVAAPSPLVLPPAQGVSAALPSPTYHRTVEAQAKDYDGPGGTGRSTGAAPAGPGLQVGLGIASLALGIVGLLIAFIPVVGIVRLPVTGIGLMLGIVALIVGVARNKQALALPIAGSAVNAVAILVAGVYVLLLSRVIGGVSEESRKRSAQVQVKTSLTNAVQAYVIDHGGNPPASLEQLLQQDSGVGGPYLETRESLFDPWARPYQYNPVGVNQDTGQQGPEIFTQAPDGTLLSNLRRLP